MGEMPAADRAGEGDRPVDDPDRPVVHPGPIRDRPVAVPQLTVVDPSLTLAKVR
jgi:hypothetical protein